MGNFYKDKRWIKKRANVLRRDEYICRQCKRYGKTTAATMVHHIFPVDLYPLLKLITINLLSLCLGCHGQMHDRITNVITDKGMEWQQRVSPHLNKI